MSLSLDSIFSASVPVPVSIAVPPGRSAQVPVRVSPVMLPEKALRTPGRPSMDQKTLSPTCRTK